MASFSSRVTGSVCVGESLQPHSSHLMSDVMGRIAHSFDVIGEEEDRIWELQEQAARMHALKAAGKFSYVTSLSPSSSSSSSSAADAAAAAAAAELSPGPDDEIYTVYTNNPGLRYRQRHHNYHNHNQSPQTSPPTTTTSSFSSSSSASASAQFSNQNWTTDYCVGSSSQQFAYRTIGWGGGVRDVHGHSVAHPSIPPSQNMLESVFRSISFGFSSAVDAMYAVDAESKEQEGDRPQKLEFIEEDLNWGSALFSISDPQPESTNALIDELLENDPVLPDPTTTRLQSGPVGAAALIPAAPNAPLSSSNNLLHKTFGNIASNMSQCATDVALLSEMDLVDGPATSRRLADVEMQPMVRRKSI